MRVHQCPHCELRFAEEAEVKDHLTADHDMEPERLREHPPGWREEMREERRAPDLMHPGPGPGGDAD